MEIHRLTSASETEGDEPSPIDLQISTAGINRKVDLHIAVVERGIMGKIPAGENTGAILSHDNVARVWRTIQHDGKEGHRIRLTLPKDLNPEQSSVIAYAQNPAEMQILAAAEVDLADS